jgi:hypothetical protein
MVRHDKEDILYYNKSEVNKCFTITYPHTGSRLMMKVLDNFNFDSYELKNNKLIYKKSGSQHNHTFDLFEGHENYKLMISCRNPYDIFVSKFRFWLGGVKVMKSTFNLNSEFLEFIEEFIFEIEERTWFKPSHLLKSEKILTRPIDYRIKLENLEESYSKVPFIADSEFAKNGFLLKELNNKIGDHKQLKLVKPWVSHLPKDFRDFYTQETADLVYNNFKELFLFMDYHQDSWKK